MKADRFTQVSLLAIAGLALWLLIAFGSKFGITTAGSGQQAYPVGTSTAILPTLSMDNSACDRVFSDRLTLPVGSDKQVMEEKEYQACMAAPNPLVVTPGQLPTATLSTTLADLPRTTAGDGTIVDNGGFAPLPSMAYSMLNEWYEQLPSKYIAVYAGATTSRPGISGDFSLGVVVVVVTTLDQKPVPDEGGAYQPSAAVGPLRIVDAAGQRLTLTSSNGTVLFFDVVSRQFTQSASGFIAQRQAGKGILTETGVTTLPVPGVAIENQWSINEKDQRITVFAGSLHKDDNDTDNQQGVLVVVVTSANDTNKIVEETSYQTPVQFGSLRIADALGEQLILAASEGGKFVFDLPTRQFISSPEMPIQVALTPSNVPSTPVVTVSSTTTSNP